MSEFKLLAIYFIKVKLIIICNFMKSTEDKTHIILSSVDISIVH